MECMINNLKNLDVGMFVPISPNINWHNKMNHVHARNKFKKLSQHVHLSAVSSDIGLEPNYLNTPLVGRAAIITLGLWSSKVYTSQHDTTGMGTFTITTLAGKGNKKKSFIGAYISVQKGSDVGVESLYVQQLTIHEKWQTETLQQMSKCFCPRKDAIQQLNILIREL